MNKYHKIPRSMWLRQALSISYSVFILVLSFQAVSALNETAIHQSVVRIEANGNFASGFLFGGDDQVVTSLHAVLPTPQTIEIYCKGNAVDAKVVKYLKEADLVLLKATSSLEQLGCKPYPQLQQNPTRPSIGDNLAAFGFRDDNRRSAFAKTIQKGSGSPETLAGLVPDEARKIVRKLGMPDADLPLYHISGGLYPGLSGGPVFLIQTGELVGIVEGGLDAGVSNHAWLIPISNLKTLLASANNPVLPNIDPSDYGYSSPSAQQTDKNSIQYKNPDSTYRWVKTKTRSFEQLLLSADKRLGLEELLDDIFPELENPADRNATRDALNALSFDIYEESEQGVIIAVPEGSKLEAIKEEDDDYHYLAVQNEKETADFEVDYGSNKILMVRDANDNVVHPSEQRYFAEALDEFMLNKCQNSPSLCYFDDEDAPAITIDFGQNRKLMRFSYHTEIIENGNFVEAEYFAISILVKGDKVMKVDSLTVLNQDSAVLQCMIELTVQACGKSYWKQAAFLLAARLSSFTNLGGSSEQSEPTVLNYKCEICADLNESIMLGEQDEQSEQPEHDNTTADWSITYVNQQSIPLFMQLADGSWFINMQGEYMQATVQGQQTFPDGNEHMILVYQDTFYAVPFNGGYYQMAPAGGEWSVGEAVYAQPNE